MAQFKAGDKKPENSGRKKGQPNKKTLALVELLEAAAYCPVDKILKVLKNPKARLTDADRVRFNLELMSYLYPKRKAIEVKQESTGKIQFVSKDELNGGQND